MRKTQTVDPIRLTLDSGYLDRRQLPNLIGGPRSRVHAAVDIALGRSTPEAPGVEHPAQAVGVCQHIEEVEHG